MTTSAFSSIDTDASSVAPTVTLYASCIFLMATTLSFIADDCLSMKGIYFIMDLPKSTMAFVTMPKTCRTLNIALATIPSASINRPKVTPTNFPTVVMASLFSLMNAVMPLATSVSSVFSPPSPSSMAVSANASWKLEKAPLNVSALASKAPANSSLPMLLMNPSISSVLFFNFVSVPLNMAVRLSPSTLTLIPSCLSISNSPVVALNTALATSSNLLPIPAAMFPISLIMSCVGLRPAFLNVTNALDTSSSWNVVPAVNFLINSKASPAFIASPSMVTKVAFRSSKVLTVLTILPTNLAAPMANNATPAPLRIDVNFRPEVCIDLNCPLTDPRAFWPLTLMSTFSGVVAIIF